MLKQVRQHESGCIECKGLDTIKLIGDGGAKSPLMAFSLSNGPSVDTSFCGMASEKQTESLMNHVIHTEWREILEIPQNFSENR